jgi:hypothetical protein
MLTEEFGELCGAVLLQVCVCVCFGGCIGASSEW